MKIAKDFLFYIAMLFIFVIGIILQAKPNPDTQLIGLIAIFFSIFSTIHNILFIPNFVEEYRDNLVFFGIFTGLLGVLFSSVYIMDQSATHLQTIGIILCVSGADLILYPLVIYPRIIKYLKK